MKDEKICGKCKHHFCTKGDWHCDNPESEYYTDYTEYNDGCDDFESRNEE